MLFLDAPNFAEWESALDRAAVLRQHRRSNHFTVAFLAYLLANDAQHNQIFRPSAAASAVRPGSIGKAEPTLPRVRAFAILPGAFVEDGDPRRDERFAEFAFSPPPPHRAPSNSSMDDRVAGSAV